MWGITLFQSIIEGTFTIGGGIVESPSQVRMNFSEKGDGIDPGSIGSGSGGTMYIGSQEGRMVFMQGYLDEIRISNTIRDDAWIRTSYNNQDTPSSFLSFGPEEIGP